MSDVLIKGIEMPSGCGLCPMLDVDEEENWYCCLIGDRFDRKRYCCQRYGRCPLVEVPKKEDMDIVFWSWARSQNRKDMLETLASALSRVVHSDSKAMLGEYKPIIVAVRNLLWEYTAESVVCD